MRGGGLGSEESSMDRDSFEDFSAEEMLVMNHGDDGEDIPNQLDNLNINDEEEKPSKSLIVTNVDLSVFIDDLVKAEFESRFHVFDSDIAFYYIRTFRRVRIDFSNSLAATAARTSLDQLLIGNNVINVYFIRVRVNDPDDVFLAPPPLEKQFLISPPCSPPVGWEQPKEDQPVVDYDLLAAMAQLAPGEDHELHPSKSITIRGASVDLPSIVVHVCQGDGESGALGGRGTKIFKTRCPDRQNSIED